MDWTRCLICQTDTEEALKCPLNENGTGDKSGPYTHFLDNVEHFRQRHALPVPVKFQPDVIVSTLVFNSARWHKSCHRKFSTDKLERVSRKRNSEDGISPEEKHQPKRQVLDQNMCIFCCGSQNLQEFSTLDADTKVRQMATELQDSQLLSTIQGGDLVALEAKYHLNCLTRLRNRHRSLQRSKEQSTSGTHEKEKILEARVFTELVLYVENAVEDGVFHFRFSELRQMYQKRLTSLGIAKELNKRRFKDHILQHFPQAQEQSDGKNIILIFQQGMQEMLRQASSCDDFEGDAMILAKAAKIVRKEIFSSERFDFKKESALPEEATSAFVKAVVQPESSR